MGIYKPKLKPIVTKKGIELGLDPKVTEYVDQVLRSSTKSIIMPLHETERDRKVADTDIYKGFVTIIMEDSNGYYKGFAERDYAGKTIRIETDALPDLNMCGKELRNNITLTAKTLKYIN